MPQPFNGPALVSQLLAGDAGLRGVVHDFVRGLDGRLTELRQAYDKLDWRMLTVLAHRLKGAAGSYGYPDISQVCATMEQAFQMHQADAFAAWIGELERLAVAAREGLQPDP